MIIVVLLILVLIMVVVISIPTVQYFMRRSEELGCGTALDTARRQLATAYMSAGGFRSVDEAKEAFKERVMEETRGLIEYKKEETNEQQR